MKKADEIYENFLAALRFKVKEGGHGSQKILAADTNISVTYLSKIIKKKKKTSFENQIEICRYFGYEYQNFLKLGEAVLRAEKTYPNISWDKEFDLEKHRDIGSYLQAIDSYLQKLTIDVSFAYPGETTKKANETLEAISELRSVLDSEVFREHPEMELNQKVAVYYGSPNKKLILINVQQLNNPDDNEESVYDNPLLKFSDRNRAWAKRMNDFLLELEKNAGKRKVVESVIESLVDQMRAQEKEAKEKRSNNS